MFKFEPALKNKELENNNKSEKKNIFQKIRSNSDKINKGLQVLAVGSIGAGLGELAVKMRDKINENKIELSEEKERTKKYDTSESIMFTTDTTKYLSDSFISEIVIKENTETRVWLLSEKEEIIKLLNKSKCIINNEDYINNLIKLNYDNGIEIKDISSFKEEINKRNEKDINGFEKRLDEVNLEIQKDEVSINDKKKEFKNRIIEIMVLIEEAKLEVIKHIESSEYLEKLSKEMNFSRKLAKLHQVVRINNIKNISYDLKSSNQISKDTKGSGYAYYSTFTNKITLPYTVNLKNEDEKNFLYESIVHEILHESTMYNEGISGTVEEFLRDSFKSIENEEKEDSSYYSKPGELIVRKQILDLNMEKNGIKKYGEKFNEEHYQKLLKLKKEGNLTPNENQLIDHIKPEDFINVMNELAGLDNNDKNYYNPNWYYGENQA